jgi:quercetin dioxygenase-like cupin family protein
VLKLASATLYTTTIMPPDLNNDADIKVHKVITSQYTIPAALPNGTVCRYVDFALSSKGFMHRTQSLHYGIMMEGEVILELDDGTETHFKRGDVCIQRATIHEWSNPSAERARMLFVLMDCRPITVNGRRFKEDLGNADGYVPPSGNDAE